ncbi:MAG TPA: serine/threonine-protein kinase, partial [Terriglobales bacterium]|nr:serine/threonine-protein kinase [Terriglobales bacterium]
MAARALKQPDLAGQTLGHYRLVEHIGAGGMGVVYRARDLHLECDVAVKVLPPGALGDEDARKRFRKEALALSKINHPNIEVAHDFDTQDGIDFLVTEFIPGQTLEVALASRLPENDILDLGAQLAEGLAAAHEQGVVHRDLKPANLLVTGDGRLKILDFGLAKMIRKPSPTASTESLSQTQGTVGTLPYMAPEQVEGSKVDARADIWAAGAVLYEMATRQRPFPGGGVQLADAIRYQPPRPPREVNSELSPGLEAVILRCLEKDPDDRYQTARELALHLRRLQRGEAPLPAVVPRHRRRAWAFAAAAVALVMAVLLAVDPAGVRAKIQAWVAGSSPQPQIQSIAVLPFADMSAEKDQEYLADGMAEELLNALARIPELRVAARTSSFQFKGRNARVEDIGRELHVDSVLEGSVHRQGTRVRINVQLVKVADGFELWSQSYDREMNDVFAVQDEIASSVAGSLKLTLLRGTAPAPPTTSAEAYNAYLQAQYFRERRTKEDMDRSVAYYQQAL